MTTTVDAFVAPPGEPLWCARHYEPSCGEAFHECDFDRTWGSFGEKLRLGLTRFDSDGQLGEARVEVQYLAAGAETEGSVSLSDEQAREFSGAVVSALAQKRRVGSSNPLALLFCCAYEAGKAFVAAVRISRADSPRTASSQS